MQEKNGLYWQLIEEHWETLWHFALGLTADRDSAEDLMSETILATEKSFPSLRNISAFKSFLCTIALRLHRRKRWRNRIFVRLEEASSEAYEYARESTHDLELLLAAISTLPEKQREAILLFEISGFSLEEIRELQGGSLSSVKMRLMRARESLKNQLEDPYFPLKKSRSELLLTSA